MIENWTEFIIGIWLILSPWVLGFSNMVILKWSSVLSGLIIGLINGWILFVKNKEENKTSEK
jgi:hypothetical protein